MATIKTNIITLALKQKLIGATLTFSDASTIEVADYEYDPDTDTFMIQGINGDLIPVAATKMGDADNIGLTKPSGNRQKKKKLKA